MKKIITLFISFLVLISCDKEKSENRKELDISRIHTTKELFKEVQVESVNINGVEVPVRKLNNSTFEILTDREIAKEILGKRADRLYISIEGLSILMAPGLSVLEGKFKFKTMDNVLSFDKKVTVDKDNLNITLKDKIDIYNFLGKRKILSLLSLKSSDTKGFTNNEKFEIPNFEKSICKYGYRAVELKRFDNQCNSELYGSATIYSYKMITKEEVIRLNMERTRRGSTNYYSVNRVSIVEKGKKWMQEKLINFDDQTIQDINLQSYEDSYFVGVRKYEGSNFFLDKKEYERIMTLNPYKPYWYIINREVINAKSFGTIKKYRVKRRAELEMILFEI